MVTLKLDPFDYLNTQELKYGSQYSDAQLKKAYSYFRNIAVKRINRLEQAGYTSGAQYQRLKAIGTPYVQDIAGRSALVMHLQQTAFFITTETSTVSGVKRVRAQKLKQFQSYGFKITDKDLDGFIDFFDAIKRTSGKWYQIEIAANAYNQGMRRRISPDKILSNYRKMVKDYNKATKR